MARTFEVAEAGGGRAAIRLAADRRPDVILLDLGLPDMDGIDVIRSVRGRSRVPILVLSARHTSEEKIRALDAGADDYVTKPFSMDELRATTRRQEDPGSPARPSGITTDEFTVDLAARKVVRGELTVRLPPTVSASSSLDRVELRVVDRGPGVPDEAEDRIFEPFQRPGDAPRGAGVGLGLGLAVARGFTEAIGGTLTAEDTPVLTLPTAGDAPSRTPQLPASAIT
ncbi:response regulator [Streptomyces sp. NPDC049949]|uniref:response regulator n=1 Tax=Streptomyces sp. NPDC049949 TaxID=3154627 RepID=UPI003412E595